MKVTLRYGSTSALLTRVPTRLMATKGREKLSVILRVEFREEMRHGELGKSADGKHEYEK